MLRLAFAKVLLGHGLARGRVQSLLEAVMDATGSDIADVADTLRATEDAMHAGQPTTGASVVLDTFGQDTGGKVLSAIARVVRTRASDDAYMLADTVVIRGGELSELWTALKPRCARQPLPSTNAVVCSRARYASTPLWASRSRCDARPDPLC